jgi:hypothetical protein
MAYTWSLQATEQMWLFSYAILLLPIHHEEPDILSKKVGQIQTDRQAGPVIPV